MKTYYTHIFLWLFFTCIAHRATAQFFPPVKQRSGIAEVGLFKEWGYANSYLLNVNISREYRIRTWFSFGIEGSIYKFNNDDYSTFGLGVRPVTRIFFISKRKWELFGESKGGIIYMMPDYQHRAVNFMFVGSLGADMYFWRNTALRVSAGYNHFSNGKSHADLYNPTWDGVGISLGILSVLP